MFAHTRSKKLGHGTMTNFIGTILSRSAVYPDHITVTNLNKIKFATPFLAQGGSSSEWITNISVRSFWSHIFNLYRWRQWYMLYVFLCSYNEVMAWKQFPHHPPFVARIHQSSVDTPNKRTVIGALGFPFMSSCRSTWTNSRVAIDWRRDGAHITTL